MIMCIMFSRKSLKAVWVEFSLHSVVCSVMLFDQFIF